MRIPILQRDPIYINPCKTFFEIKTMGPPGNFRKLIICSNIIMELLSRGSRSKYQQHPKSTMVLHFYTWDALILTNRMKVWKGLEVFHKKKIKNLRTIRIIQVTPIKDQNKTIITIWLHLCGRTHVNRWCIRTRLMKIILEQGFWSRFCKRNNILIEWRIHN